MKKRAAFLAFVLLLPCLLFGCGKDPANGTGTSPASVPSETSALTQTVAEPQTETVSFAPDAAQLYTDYLQSSVYDELLFDYNDPETEYQAEACLADINDDGVKELLLHITNKTAAGVRGFPAVTFLLGLRDGEVEQLGVADYGGGSGGGDYLFIRYDTVEKKHVLEYEEFVRDGMFFNTMAHHYFDVTQRDAEDKAYGLSGGGNVVYRTAHTLRCNSFAVEGVYASDAEKVMRDTKLYTKEDGIVTAYLYDDAYISETDYNALRARFVEPTDPAYRMTPVTLDDPIPSA